ncbi:MAG: hypothetical protein HC896_13575 [Bacteroidales bacterium]|nr:hypothetical protein [Bacteroidales bacterium]
MYCLHSIKINLFKAGNYNVKITTHLPGDEDTENDLLTTKLYIQPTVSLPYIQEFATDSGYFFNHGAKNVWHWATPGTGIYPPPSPDYAWITVPGGNYKPSDTSYLESVCFNMPDFDNVVLDFEYWMETESQKDGMVIQFSIDEGENWQYFPNDTFAWNWNWYNNTIASLGLEGFTGNSAGWKRVQQIVPSDVVDKEGVKFRFMFVSDSANQMRGFAIDNFKLAAAPMDIGVTEFVGLNNACQHVNDSILTLAIQNYSLNDMIEGSLIVVGMKLDNQPKILDTLLLPKVLPAFDTIHVRMKTSLGFNKLPGAHIITAFTTGEQLPNIYGSDNDTAKTPIFIYENPITLLPDSVGSLIPDTFNLRPKYDPDYTYLWTGGSTNRVFDVPGVGYYSVTVTDSDSTGCTTTDVVKVVQYFRDLGVDSILHPVSSCEYTNAENVVARLRNFGTEPLRPGEEYVLAYQFEGGTVVTDTILIEEEVAAYATVSFVFDNNTINIEAPAAYHLKAFSKLSGDTLLTNDTVNVSFNVFGYPTIGLGPDTIVRDTSFVLRPATGYPQYLWNDSTTADSLYIDTTGTYTVSVTSIHGCTATENRFVYLKYLDLVPRVKYPLSKCVPETPESIMIEVFNFGTDTLQASDKIDLSYRIGNGELVSETFDSQANVPPGGSSLFTFATAINLVPDVEWQITGMVSHTDEIVTKTTQIVHLQ